MAPMWKKLMKHVDLDEPKSFLDHEHLGCTQRECQPNEITIEQHIKMFESRISAGATENFSGSENFTQKLLRGPTTWKDMLENALSDTASWQIKKWSRFTKFQVFAWMIINSNKKNLNQWENYHKCAHRLSWNAWYLARIGRPDILWSVKQSCKSSYTMDKSLWQTLGSFDFWHSSHKWLPTLLSCGKQSSALSIGRRWRLKINFGWNLMCLWKSNTRPHKLAVQEAQRQCLTVPQKRPLFRLDACLRMDGPLLLMCGMWWWKCYIPRIIRNHQPKEQQENCLRNSNTSGPKRWSVIKCRFCDHKRTLFSKQSPVVHFLRPRSCDQDDHQRDWLFDKINWTPPSSKSNMSTPKTNLRTL